HALAIWSAHDGEDTLFNELAQEARACCGADSSPRPILAAPEADGGGGSGEESGERAPSTLDPRPSSPPSGPWNLYFRVTMPDAIQLGLVDVINRARGTHLTPDEFLAGCRA